jgi:hypothetical protein
LGGELGGTFITTSNGLSASLPLILFSIAIAACPKAAEQQIISVNNVCNDFIMRMV